MRTFVTGGSGFVGRNLIPALVARGHTVRALARSASAQESVRRLGAEPWEGDLSSEERLREGMAGCNVVFHVAALASQWGKAEDFIEANVRGTERVLRAARAAGVKRVVHVSTEALLVDGQPLVNVDESRPIPTSPIGLYPATKAQAERLVVAANSPELETVVVRPRFIWGQGDTTVLPVLIETIQSGRFRWIGGGRYKTSTCHVANCVEGMLLAAEKGRPGEVYFLTDGEPVEFRSFITALLRTQGVEPGEGAIPRWLAYTVGSVSERLWSTFGLKGAPPVTRFEVLVSGREVTVSDAKARRELGYQGHMTHEVGLKEMWLSP